MRITRLGGIVPNPSSGTADEIRPEKVEALFQTTGAITAGLAATIDAADTTGYKCKVSASAAPEQGLFIGIYEGLGGHGAAASTGYSGFNAVTGDNVWITVYGKAIATVNGLAAAVAGRPCGVETGTGGGLKVLAAAAEGAAVPVVILEAYTTTSNAAKTVFVRNM